MKITPKNQNKFPAFTLAEVLITLGIIGVVAAMTISLLINSSKNAEIEARIKKAYATFGEALKMAAITNGTPGELSSFFSVSNWTQVWYTASIANEMKVSKTCGNMTYGCFPDFNLYIDGTGATSSLSSSIFLKVLTADGMSYAIASYGTECTTDYGKDNNSPTKYSCGEVYIDVNAFKGPNRLGRDIFCFYITNPPSKGIILYPRGGLDDNRDGNSSNNSAQGNNYWNRGSGNYCNTTWSQGGNICTGRLIDHGWKFDY